MLNKIVSGGQTGVDRAALDAALFMGFSTGGWCPKGRKAEDGIIPPFYALEETPSQFYWQRTEWNVRDSDGTLIIYQNKANGGTALTIDFAKRYHKPYLLIDFMNKDHKITRETLQEWLMAHDIKTLNVAGPRASEVKNIYRKTKRYLEPLFYVIRSLAVE